MTSMCVISEPHQTSLRRRICLNLLNILILIWEKHIREKVQNAGMVIADMFVSGSLTVVSTVQSTINRNKFGARETTLHSYKDGSQREIHKEI